MNTADASAAPASGAMMNTHTSDNGVVLPVNARIRAGPNDLAGLTDVPVSGMPNMCTSVSVRPITRPATEPYSFLLVTPSMTYTKTMKINMLLKHIVQGLFPKWKKWA